jgi:predicted DNA-binding protein
VDDARDRMPDEFKKRLNNLIEKSTANKQIGYGGIDKYY